MQTARKLQAERNEYVTPETAAITNTRHHFSPAARASACMAKQLPLAAVSYFRARSARREQDLQANKRRAQASRRLQLFKCRSKARLRRAKTLVAAATAIDASLAVQNNPSVLQSAGRRRVRVVRRAAGRWEGSTW
eukprot:6210646-Pleurochrysis_carterae.AAC.1